MRDLEAARARIRKRAPVSWRAAIHMVQADYEKDGKIVWPAEARSELYAVGCIAYLDGTTGKGRGRPSRSLGALARNADTPPK